MAYITNINKSDVGLYLQPKQKVEGDNLAQLLKGINNIKASKLSIKASQDSIEKSKAEIKDGVADFEQMLRDINAVNGYEDIELEEEKKATTLKERMQKSKASTEARKKAFQERLK
ncbi:hypothetical protein [Vibrio gallicus]|uniref:hypothetical protein n=1 Tax=Vibrio gallicus TaxID=190897 RepID=UPI0021C356FE|nr:hypothetical protein [Vibrio gallicus]